MASQAIKLGAEGIGLCRTERQFSGPERLSAIREFILQGLPIVIRLLDLPLHEFLPSEAETSSPPIRQRIAELKEINPKNIVMFRSRRQPESRDD